MTDPTRRETLQAMTAFGTLAFIGSFSSDSGQLPDPGIFDNINVGQLVEDDDTDLVAEDINALLFDELFTAEETDDEVSISLDKERLQEFVGFDDIDGLTNPLTEPLDADNNDITNVDHLDSKSHSTENISIDNFSRSTAQYTITKEDGYIMAVGRNGDLKVGGPDELEVNDATDLTGILEAIDAREDYYFSVEFTHLGGFDNYEFKTPCTLNSAFSWWGAGKNRGVLTSADSLEGETLITVEDPDEASSILRMDSLKISSSEETAPGTILDVSGVRELLLTNCEFRGAKDWGVDYQVTDGTPHYNYVSNCWFLIGAGARFQDVGRITFLGNELVSGADVEFIDCDQVIAPPHLNLNGSEYISYTNTTRELPSDDLREKIGEIDVSGVSTINESIDNVDANSDNFVFLEVVYEDNENEANNNLSITLEGMDDGEYSYTLMDEGMSPTPRSEQDEYVLIEPTRSILSDRFVGQWKIGSTNSSKQGITGSAVPTVRQEGRALAKGFPASAGSASDTVSEFDITFHATAGGDDLSLEVTAFQTNSRQQMPF